MNKVEVTNGWIILRDPKQVPERLRRPLVTRSPKAYKMIQDGIDDLEVAELEFFSEYNDLLAIALVAEWSFAPQVNLEELLN